MIETEDKMAFTNRTRTEKTVQVFVIHIAVIIVIAFIVAAGLTSYRFW